MGRHRHCFNLTAPMRSPIRALLVAVVTMLGLTLALPSVAEAKPKPGSHHVTRTTKTRSAKSAKSTKRVVKHPWSKGRAKAHAKARPHRG